MSENSRFKISVIKSTKDRKVIMAMDYNWAGQCKAAAQNKKKLFRLRLSMLFKKPNCSFPCTY